MERAWREYGPVLAVPRLVAFWAEPPNQQRKMVVVMVAVKKAARQRPASAGDQHPPVGRPAILASRRAADDTQAKGDRPRATSIPSALRRFTQESIPLRAEFGPGHPVTWDGSGQSARRRSQSPGRGLPRPSSQRTTVRSVTPRAVATLVRGKERSSRHWRSLAPSSSLFTSAILDRVAPSKLSVNDLLTRSGPGRIVWTWQRRP